MISVGDFFESVKSIRQNTDICCVDYDDSALANVVYEGSQGLLLDQNIGFFPHVTRANTGTKSIRDKISSVYYITRAYQTRHGNGPMTNTGIKHNIRENPFETNITNDFQGEFKRSILDVSLLEYAINRDAFGGTCNLVITCLDDVFGEYKYTYNGKLFTHETETEFVKSIMDILNIRNVYLSRSPYSECIQKGI